MNPVELLMAGAVLAAVLVVGTVVHELSHALALRALGVPCRIEWFPDRDATRFASVGGGWAAVVPRAISSDLAPWRLRVAALTPLTLAAPVLLVAAGLLPNPVAAGHPAATVGAIAWLAFALPSPQDFSLVWHAEEAVERYTT